MRIIQKTPTLLKIEDQASSPWVVNQFMTLVLLPFLTFFFLSMGQGISLICHRNENKTGYCQVRNVGFLGISRVKISIKQLDEAKVYRLNATKTIVLLQTKDGRFFFGKNSSETSSNPVENPKRLANEINFFLENSNQKHFQYFQYGKGRLVDFLLVWFSLLLFILVIVNLFAAIVSIYFLQIKIITSTFDKLTNDLTIETRTIANFKLESYPLSSISPVFILEEEHKIPKSNKTTIEYEIYVLETATEKSVSLSSFFTNQKSEAETMANTINEFMDSKI
jgi:hypothetical protein